MGLSVKNFKQIIFAALILLVLIPTILAIHFGQKSAELERRMTGTGDGSGSHNNVGYLTPVAEPAEYQELYPELYGSEDIPRQRVRANNTVYLTFDSNLTNNTDRILDILKECGIQATFFVPGASNEDEAARLKRIVEEGHSIGVSSASESYQDIYRSIPAYLEDFKEAWDGIYEATGVRTQMFRFPGGSINSYDSGIYRELVSEMLRRRFVFFDWNVSGEDTRLKRSGEQIREAVNAGLENCDRGIIFLQDGTGKESVVDALPGIIQDIQSRGYVFQALTTEVLPVVFSYQNAP